MNVSFFANEYKSSNNKKALLNKIMNDKKYVPYEEKASDCKRMVEVTSTLKHDDIEEYHVDSTNRWYLFITNFLKKYTVLEFNDETLLADYNALVESKAFDDIMSYVADNEWLNREYMEYKTIINMVVDDAAINNQSVLPYIRSLINTIGKQITPEMIQQFQDSAK